jgi:hypothetical protein
VCMDPGRQSYYRRGGAAVRREAGKRPVAVPGRMRVSPSYAVAGSTDRSRARARCPGRWRSCAHGTACAPAAPLVCSSIGGGALDVFVGLG